MNSLSTSSQISFRDAVSIVLLLIIAALLLTVAAESAVLWSCGLSLKSGISSIEISSWFAACVVIGFFYFLFWMVTGRTSSALLLNSAALGILVFANSQKYRAFGRELTLNDVSLIGDVFNVLPDVISSSPRAFAILGLAGIIFLAGLFWTLRRPARWPLKWTERLAMAALMAGLSAFEAQYSFIIQLPGKGGTFDSRQDRAQHGFFLSLLRSRGQFLARPANYSAEAVKKALELPETVKQPSEIPLKYDFSPDVIVYLGESFMDLEARLPHARFSRQPQPHFQNILNTSNAISGIHVSPEISGLTANVEFEVLSGIPMAALPPQAVPFYGLLDHPVESLPSVLRSRGYSTTALHNYRREDYRRPSAYRLLGLNAFSAIEDMKPYKFDGQPIEGVHSAIDVTDGQWPSDEILVREILDQLKRGEKTGVPQFIHAVSMVSHGSYGRWKGGAKHLVTVTQEDGSRVPDELEGLASALNSADDALGLLLNAIETRERPTVLLFFGDHVPWANKENLKSVGFDDSPRHLYDMPWFIVSNRPISRIRSQIPKQISTFYLPSVLLYILGIDVPYFQALRENMMVNLPVFRQGLMVNGDGGEDSGGNDAFFKLLAYDRLKGNGHSEETKKSVR